MRQLTHLAAICVSTAMFTGCGGGPSHESPQAAYNAMQKAIQADDWETAAWSMTAESQETMAGGMVMMLSFTAMFDEERADEIAALLKEHGIDVEDESEEPVHFNMNGSDQTAGLRKLAEGIDDKPAFIGDAMGMMKKMSEDEGDSPFEWPNGKLEDLKIDGNTASAVVISTVDGREDREPIEFRKTDDGWLVHLPGETFQATSSSSSSSSSSAEFESDGFAGMPDGFGDDSTEPAEPVEFHFPDRPVSGTIHGQKFQPTKFELDGGDLTFSQGEEFFPDFRFALSLSMLMEQGERVDNQRYEITNPQQFIKPHVGLHWTEPGKEFTETEFADNYVFRVEFDERKARTMTGRIEFRSMKEGDDTKIAGNFTAEVAPDLERPPTELDVPYVYGRIELKGAGEHKLYASIIGLTSEGKRIGNGAGTTFKPGGRGAAASLTFKPQISAIRSSKEDGITYRHISLVAGTYFVYVQADEQLADWRWIELTDDDRVTLDLVVDPTRRGGLTVNVAGGKDNTPVLLAPLDGDAGDLEKSPESIPAVAARIGLASRLKLAGKLKDGTTTFAELYAGRYRAQADGKSADVEVRPGQTAAVTLTE